MTTIRQELETKLAAFAAAQSPALQVAYESVPFPNKPQSPWLECFLNKSNTTNVTTDGTRIRERGTFQVNVWAPSGSGMAKVEQIAAAVVSAFPVVPKTGTVSIEQTPSSGKAILDVSGYIIVPVTMMYRQEGTA